jgi:hypothetical protein
MKTLNFAYLLLSLSLSTVPAFAGVTVSSPTNGETVIQSFTLSANASICSNQNVAAIGYSLDSGSDIADVYTTSVQAQVSSAVGAHTLHVKAWGNSGAVCVTDVPITVTSSTAPSNTVAVSNIQTLANWRVVNDPAAGGGSTGAMSLKSTPSTSGSARQFATTYTNYGGELYHVSFGDDTTSTNFSYDASVYIAAGSNLANLEMDMNQVMANGQTVIFGFQCDGWSGTWDYTTNSGTPQKPVDKWLHSAAACNPNKWTTNAWHHIQISYSRDDAGMVTYKSVTLDGTQSILNVTVPSAFALGWAPALLTNFQVDGNNTKGSSVIYLDNVTISRW